MCVAMWFDISIAVRTFVGLHTNRKRDSRSYENFHSKWSHEVNVFLSNDTETLKSGEFLFSSVLVLVAPCIYEVRRWGKEMVDRMQRHRFSRNGEGEKKILRGHFYTECIALSTPMRYADLLKKYIYNNSMFIQYKIISIFTNEKPGFFIIAFYYKKINSIEQDVPCHHRSVYLYIPRSINKVQFYFIENCPSILKY